MSGYLRTVIAVVMFVSLMNGILPKENAGKYVSFVSGLIITVVLLSPIFSIFKDESFSLSGIETEILNTEGTNYLMGEFEKNLAQRIESELSGKTKVTVYSETNENGEITGVEKVEISPYTEKIADEISNLLSIDKSKVEEK